MRIHIISATLFSSVLLSSCSSVTSTDIRPEVSQPLNEAMRLSGYWTPDKAAIMAQLNQAASVPNLNSDEISKIRATAAVALAKVHEFPRTVQEINNDAQPYPDDSKRPDYSQTLGYKGLNYGN